MKKLASLLASLALAAAAAGCSGTSGSPADYPADFRVTAGDGAVTVTWTMEPGVEYWIFYGPGENITTANWVTSGGVVAANVTSPKVITNLINGKTYSFTINGRRDGGPGGSGAPTQVAVPRLAGTSWTVGAPLGPENLNGIAGGNGASGYTSIAVGEAGRIYTSINYAPPVAATNPAAPARLNAIAYTVFGWVAIGDNGTALTTQDGTTWTAQATGTTANLLGVTGYSNGGFIAVGVGGVILVSSNGGAWTPVTSGTTSDLRASAFGNGRYVAVGSGGTIVTSADGVTWEPTPSGVTATLRSVAYAAIPSATDASTVEHRFIAVGDGGLMLTSSDGLAWTAIGQPGAGNLNAIVYGTQFVLVGQGGLIWTSPDGVTWTNRSSGTTKDLNAVTRTQAGYSAVGAAGTLVITN